MSTNHLPEVRVPSSTHLAGMALRPFWMLPRDTWIRQKDKVLSLGQEIAISLKGHHILWESTPHCGSVLSHLFAWYLFYSNACVAFLFILSHLSQNSFWHAGLSTEAHKNSARGVLTLLSISIGPKL